MEKTIDQELTEEWKILKEYIESWNPLYFIPIDNSRTKFKIFYMKNWILKKIWWRNFINFMKYLDIKKEWYKAEKQWYKLPSFITFNKNMKYDFFIFQWSSLSIYVNICEVLWIDKKKYILRSFTVL